MGRILPCRFCHPGAEQAIETYPVTGDMRVVCECGASGTWRQDRKQAIADWADMMATPTVRTLRDEFAKAALAGMLAAETKDHHYLSSEKAARAAYEVADAMLAARERAGA